MGNESGDSRYHEKAEKLEFGGNGCGSDFQKAWTTAIGLIPAIMRLQPEWITGKRAGCGAFAGRNEKQLIAVRADEKVKRQYEAY